MAALIPLAALDYFENAIYLPILIKILEADRMLFEEGPFKLKRPYTQLIEGTLKIVRTELKETNEYLRKNDMRLTKNKTDKVFTEYIFVHGGYEDARRYLNFRLKNRSEELISMYFDMMKTPK
jgi:hypothetical protein